MTISLRGAVPGRVFTALLLAAAVAWASTSWGTQAQERIVERYLEAAAAGGPQAMVEFYLASDVEDFRASVIKALEQEAEQSRRAIREQLFGIGSSVEELRRLTPGNFLLATTRRIALPVLPAKKVDVIGVVEESSDRVHAVARLWADEKKREASRVTLVTLLRYGKDWRVALPESFRARVDAVIAGGGEAPRAASASGAPNTPEIMKLLESSSQVLRAGACTTFFVEHMSPNFRKSTSERALKTIISQCQARDDTRETYLTAIELAKGLAPQYQQDGTRAVYDMTGQGLPFNHFTLEKVGERWYVAE